MDERISNHLKELEKLLRDADKAVENAATAAIRRRMKKQRNAINAACNALYRAYKA